MTTLKERKLVADWRKKQPARESVNLCAEESLRRLPAVLTPGSRAEKLDLVFEHVYDSYLGDGKSLYVMT